TPIGETSAPAGGGMQAPAGLPVADGAYVRVDVAAVGAPQASWATPVQVYFRRNAGAWSLVGVERQ
ncbi:MAG: hypothetical protein JNM38_19170, partial [Acidobacteria bacterium]|nr:hypothetical protein [Acidobacteriota bacterium]